MATISNYLFNKRQTIGNLKHFQLSQTIGNGNKSKNETDLKNNNYKYKKY